MAVLGHLDVAPGMSSQRGWVFWPPTITEGDHEREHEEQDMHSEWFTRAQVERMIRDGVITDAQSIAAWTLFLTEGTPFDALMPVDQGITLDRPGFWRNDQSML